MTGEKKPSPVQLYRWYVSCHDFAPDDPIPSGRGVWVIAPDRETALLRACGNDKLVFKRNAAYLNAVRVGKVQKGELE